MAANPTTQPVIDIPRHVWDAVNNAIHTSKIDGSVQPISLCYVAVRAAIAAYTQEHPRADCEGCNKPDCPCNADQKRGEPIEISCPECDAKAGQRCFDKFLGEFQYTFHNIRIFAAKKAVQA
jgi:hypothetical protein